jgi:hypothetical protein
LEYDFDMMSSLDMAAVAALAERIYGWCWIAALIWQSPYSAHHACSQEKKSEADKLNEKCHEHLY